MDFEVIEFRHYFVLYCIILPGSLNLNFITHLCHYQCNVRQIYGDLNFARQFCATGLAETCLQAFLVLSVIGSVTHLIV